MLSSFLTYVIEMIILAALAIAGIFVGKNIRQKKDAKNSEAED